MIFSELSASDAPEPEVLMIDATDLEAHPTASSLNRGVYPPDRSHQGGHDQQAPWGLHSKGGPLRLHLREGRNAATSLVLMGCSNLPPAAAVIGDQGYDRDTIRKMLAQQGATSCIPPRRCRKQPAHDHKRLDRSRHKIEALFSRLEGLATSCNPL